MTTTTATARPVKGGDGAKLTRAPIEKHITLEVAKRLSYRQELYHVTERASNGSARRCRVNGALKTWKTRPTEFSLPVKHGLRDCFYITETNGHAWLIEDPTLLK